MSDTDLGNVFYSIVAKDTTSGGTASAAQNFFFMFNAIQEGVSIVQGLFDETVGAAFDFTGQLEQMSAITGMTTDQIQKWGAAAAASGGDLNNMANGLAYVQGLLGQNTEAGDTYRAKLDALGVVYKDNNGHLLDADTLQKNLLSSLNDITDGDARAAAAKEIYGMRWKSQAEMIDHAKEALGAYNSTTPPFNESQVADMDKARIQYIQMNYQMGIMADKVGAELIPSLTNMFTIMNEALTEGAPLLQFFDDLGLVIEDVMELFARVGGVTVGVVAGINDLEHGNISGALSDMSKYASAGGTEAQNLRGSYNDAKKAMAPGASPVTPGSGASSISASDLDQSQIDKLTAQQTSAANAVSNDQSQLAIDHAKKISDNTAAILAHTLELQKLNQKLASDSDKYNTTTNSLTAAMRQRGIPLQ